MILALLELGKYLVKDLTEWLKKKQAKKPLTTPDPKPPTDTGWDD